MAYSPTSPHLKKFIKYVFSTRPFSSLYMFYNNKKDIVFLFLCLYL
ncbi:polysaccharide deacetylase [Bacillus cereus]|nr:polysaccharide deacetylase [Bacillus cereus]